MIIQPSPEWQYMTANSALTGNAATTPGVTVVSGASNADGANATLIGTALTHDVHYLVIGLSGNTTGATDTSSLIDIGVDPAGGSSPSDFITSLQAGFLNTNLYTTGSQPRMYYFPVWIPAGSTIFAKGRNVTGSTRNIVVNLIAYGGPKRPSEWWCGQKVDTFGDVRASSGGTAVPPNASGSPNWGSWTAIGSATTYQYGAVHVSTQGPASGTYSGHAYAMQFHTDSGATAPYPGTHNFFFGLSTNEYTSDIFPTGLIRRTFPSGVTFYLRTQSASASAASPMCCIHAIR